MVIQSHLAIANLYHLRTDSIHQCLIVKLLGWLFCSNRKKSFQNFSDLFKRKDMAANNTLWLFEEDGWKKNLLSSKILTLFNP